ncbi:MAG TPA: amidohydrolase family protein [Acidimicrobiales bacterium]|nr:amidohydrolase family protein [Acidimicrobiales bacterium]
MKGAAMLDLLLRGGDVVDGTGGPRVRANVGVRDGRIVSVGSTSEPAARTIDVTGLVIAPGFVDIHTHYDAQLLWDPAATPSPLHGVTTVLAGNCGFTIAPVEPEHVDYVMRMMARVEGMPLESLRAGPAWQWRTFGEYLDRLEGRICVNAGFLVGHSTLRRVVMGDLAVGTPATAEQIAAMVQLAHESMADGALGVSSSLGEAHTDGDGQPVPSRAASREELLALARAVREHEGTTLEFIAAMGEISDERIVLMTDMSLTANRPLNWNLLGSLSPTEVYEQQLTSCDHARAHGARVVALTLPDVMRMRASRVIEDLPGWRDIVALPAEERRRRVQDPAVRAQLRAGAHEAAARGLGAMARFDLLEIAEDPPGAAESVAGRSVAEVAAARGADPIDVLIDVVLPDRLPLQMVFPSLVPSLGVSDESWQARAAVWRDDRTVLGGSDAGAHVDLMCHANYTTVLLGESVRERGLLTLESAVHQITDVPARLYGLRERGRVCEGWYADLVVFDPDRIGSEPARARHDLPGGGLRLYAEAVGVAHVFVNGTEIVRDNVITGEPAGTLLRSGRDTDTVTVPGGERGRAGH